MNEKNIERFEAGKKIAIALGGAVYVGVVILFLVFYEKLMSSQFEGLLRVFANIGAFLVALNSIALPLALHFWAVEGKHKATAIVFYAGDILIMGLNVLAAANLNNASGWLADYQGYAPASIVYVLAGWAILFMTDPGQRALVRLQGAILDAQVELVKRATEHIQSDEGIENIIVPFASKLAGLVFNQRRLIGVSRGLGSVPTDTTDPDIGVNDTAKDVVAALLAELRAQTVTPKPEPLTPTEVGEDSTSNFPGAEQVRGNGKH